MDKLKAALAKLQEKNGNSSLATEIVALLGAEAPVVKKEPPLPLRILALAAAEINKGDKFEYAHDCVGAAIEAYRHKGDDFPLTAAFKQRLEGIEVAATADTALKIPLPEVNEEVGFAEASSALVTAFADALISAGYSKEAKKYVEAYNNLHKGSDMDKRQALMNLRKEFKKTGRLDMVRAADEMMESLEEEKAEGAEELEEAPAPENAGESKAGLMLEEAKGCGDEGVKSAMMKASYMMKAAEDMEKDGLDAKAMKDEAEEHMAKARDMLKEQADKQEYQTAANAKPTLYVEAPSSKERRLRAEASRAAASGDLRRARGALVKADSLERSRLIAALILAGDSDLAMDGLKEEGGEQGGYPSQAYDETEKPEEKEEEEEQSALPEGALDAVQPSKEPEEPKEEEVADELKEKVESAVKRGNMRAATLAFVRLNDLAKAVTAGVKLSKGDKTLTKEGFNVWRKVHKSLLTAHAVLAEEEGDKKELETATDGLEKLDDESTAKEELDKALEDMDESKATEITKDFVIPPGGKPESAPGTPAPAPVLLDEAAGEEEEKEEKEEEEGDVAESMHYEVLQSLDEVKAMKVDRNALAFTYWEDDKGGNPFYVIQAAGKPIGEIHLADQDNAKEVRSYFCDETKYTKSIAQSVENTSLFEVLVGVNARFYANAVDTSGYAKKMREEAVASVSDVRTEKLATLRKDYTEAMVCASEALNKGLYDKPNALKSTFVKVLSQYGVVNPAIAVEAAFKEAGTLYFEQVLAGATEYLEMPKEAFAHAKKMISQAQNVAYAQASNFSEMSIGQRLAMNSLPLGTVPEAQEAPIVAASREVSERARVDVYKERLKLGRKIY
jgi:hypothetical protein